MPDVKRTRDPNELMKTILSVIEEYDGFIMGMGTANDFYSFSESGEGLRLSDEEQQAEQITRMRREFFATLLDTAVGAYYTQSIITGKGIFGTGSKTADLSQLGDYIKILGDTAMQTNNSSVPASVIIKESENKTPDTFASVPGSMRKMTAEWKNSNVRLIDAEYKGEGEVSLSNEDGIVGVYSDAGFRNVTYVNELTDDERADFLEEFKIPKATSEELVNKAGSLSEPSLTNKKMAAYVIKDSEFNYSKRRVEFLSLFFNGITPIEMSRCTPYIEVTFYHQNFGTHEEQFLNPAGYMKFFSNNENANGRQELQGFAGKTYPYNERESNLYDTDVGYMNIFTSPQTMVNANINSEPGKWGLGNIKTNSYNSALDPFAPQATLKNLVLSTVSGGYGFTSKKKGTIAITIHDRSRLKHFAPLISINQLAKSRVKITFGWSHPDGNIDSDNPIGKFLNAMKSTQHYTLISSNLRFQGNAVDADLEIVSMGNQHIDDVSAAAGTHIPLRSIAPAIESIVRSLIAKEKKKINKYSSEEIAYVHPQLELLIQTANSVETMVPASDYETLQQLIRGNEGGDLDRWIIIAIAYLLGIETLGEDFEVFRVAVKEERDISGEVKTNSKIRKEVANISKENTGKILREKYDNLFYRQSKKSKNSQDKTSTPLLLQPDYFTSGCFVKGYQTKISKVISGYASILNLKDSSAEHVPIDQDPNREDIAFSTEYVSLGKLIANFVAAPLISTGEYSEVQMFFYPLNSAAGAARRYTTASLPFKKDEIDLIFESKPKEDEEVDETQESIKLGTISAKTMFAKLAALTNSTDFDAYGLTAVGPEQRKIKSEEVHKAAKEGKLTSSQKDLYINSYFSKFNDKGKKEYESATKEKKEAILKAAIDQYLSETFKTKKLEILKEIYSNDNLGAQDMNTFRFPALNMHLEVLSPIRPIGEGGIPLDVKLFGAEGAVYDKQNQTEFGTGRILRIHIVDECNIGGAKVDLANQILYGGKKDPSLNNTSAKILTNGINNLSDAELKEYIKRHYATVIYGAGSSTVKSINMSSTTSDRIAQAKMMTFEKNRRSKSVSKNVNTVAESIRMVPASIDMQILGCPLIERGTIIFIDMGTNTDLDNCYVVNSVTHTISSGDFTTSLGLVVGNQGTVINARGELLQKLSALADASNSLKTESTGNKINLGDSPFNPLKGIPKT